MARTKQTARKSTGGRAPRMQLATASGRDLRNFMTSQQTVGVVSRGTNGEDAPRQASYLNHENVIGSFGFGTTKTTQDFLPTFSVATVPHPQTGLPEHWLSVQLASKYDGDGFTNYPRPPLSLVFVLDISGSMSSSLEDYNPFASGVYQPFPPSGHSKLDAAKSCLLAILTQLNADDSVGVLLFNHETHVLHEPTPATDASKKAIEKKLKGVSPGGGTRLASGYEEGVKVLGRARGDQPLRRVYFLTDMQSHLADEAAVLSSARGAASLARDSIHTTVVGMGVDLSVGTVEAISSLPGGKYGSVATVSEFERSIGAEFAHDVTPIAFDISIGVGGGWAIERCCGSAELNKLPPGATDIAISSEFASPHDTDGNARGGVLVLKLRPPATPEAAATTIAQPTASARRVTRRSSTTATGAVVTSSAATELLQVSASWTTPDGLKKVQPSQTLQLPPMGPTCAISSPSLRKALALVRFVDLQKGFCDAGGEDDERDLEGRLARLAEYKDGRRALLEDMGALGDASILEGGDNHAFAQTLDQIIAFEATETEQLQRAAERTAAAASSSSSSSRKRTRGSNVDTSAPPKELVCPILHTLMTDPVSTADGHTFEKAAIERWLHSHNTSPLTGLRLSNKTLTPNHGLRSLAQAFAGR